VFSRAQGHSIWDEDGREYIDFFAGAGALNYGHNHPQLKQSLLKYLESDGIVHSLDMATVTKRRLLERLDEVILKPRGLDYKVQFPGPTGTNAVEAALKLARKVTGRESVISFTNAFHGMTLGSLAVTGNEMKRHGAGVPLKTIAMPYENFLGGDVDTIDYLRTYIRAGGSGVDLPAAIIVETTQGEGGMNTASVEWIQRLAELCQRNEILLIVDDIQMGCGRTGPFFSFEAAGIKPDIVTLSKSISGYGLPLSRTLFRRELDVWGPGEPNGTFRGHNPAFVTATESLSFWEDDSLSGDVERRGQMMEQCVAGMAERFPEAKATQRGRGMAQGLHCGVAGLAEEIAHGAFERGVICETSGAKSEVLKLLPPLTIEDSALARGLEVLEESLAAALERRGIATRTPAAV